MADDIEDPPFVQTYAVAVRPATATSVWVKMPRPTKEFTFEDGQQLFRAAVYLAARQIRQISPDTNFGIDGLQRVHVDDPDWGELALITVSPTADKSVGVTVLVGPIRFSEEGIAGFRSGAPPSGPRSWTIYGEE